MSSNPEGPDFIDDDASYDDAPVTNDAGTEYCVLCARAVEFSADGKHSEATAQMDAALATGLASEDPVMLTTARVEGDRAYFGAGLLSEGVEVVEGDSLLHLLLRNEAAVDTVNACLKGGADVRAVNARGEHCVGLARKARAKAGQRRGNSETATAEAAARREVAAQVAQLVDKKAAQGGAPPRISMGTPQKNGPATPKSPGRRLKTPDKRGAPSPVSAAREVDCWRRVAARATEAADAVEAKVRGFVVEGDPDQMGERAVTATRTTLAEALACRGETSSDAELYARDLQRLRDDCRISQTAEGEARSLYVELEAAHEELLVRAQETEAECRRWRAVWKSTTATTSLRGRRRVDGVGRPKFDFHTGGARATKENGTAASASASRTSATRCATRTTRCAMKWRSGAPGSRSAATRSRPTGGARSRPSSTRRALA